MTVNFLCQFDEAKTCSDVCINISSDVCMRCFSKRLAFELVDWVKQMAFPIVENMNRKEVEDD